MSFASKIQSMINDTKLFDDPVRIGATTTMAQMGARIFDRGAKTDETPIKRKDGKYQNYSTLPLYVSKKQSSKIGAPKGKTGKSKFKDGKAHTSRYLPEGYKEFRKILGRQTGVVDFKLTGELRLDFSNGQVNNPKPIPLPFSGGNAYAILLRKEINQDKREGLEEKYGKVFTPSLEEKAIFIHTAQFEFNQRLKKMFG